MKVSSRDQGKPRLAPFLRPWLLDRLRFVDPRLLPGRPLFGRAEATQHSCHFNESDDFLLPPSLQVNNYLGGLSSVELKRPATPSRSRDLFVNPYKSRRPVSAPVYY